MNWLLKGLLVGATIAAVGVVIVGTGGLAAVAIVGGAAAMGAGIGELASTMSWAPKEATGLIKQTGSANVFTNNRAAARAHVDLTICSKHRPALIPIATGSSTVFINGQPAARVGDKTGCGAVITSGSNNVYIGGGTEQTGVINPENLVPGWVHTALLVVGVGSAVVLAGPVIAAGGLVGGIAGGVGGEWLGGKVFGEGSDGQKWSMLGGSVVGGLLGAKGAPGAWKGVKGAVSPKSAEVPVVPGKANISGENAAGGETTLASPKNETAGEIENAILGRARAGSANKTDPYHSFPDMVDNYVGDATKFSIPTKGPGGVVTREAELYQAQGGLNGRQGLFEWIVDQNQVTHRRFIPNGKITGYPNQIPPKL